MGSRLAARGWHLALHACPILSLCTLHVGAGTEPRGLLRLRLGHGVTSLRAPPNKPAARQQAEQAGQAGQVCVGRSARARAKWAVGLSAHVRPQAALAARCMLEAAPASSIC